MWNTIILLLFYACIHTQLIKELGAIVPRNISEEEAMLKWSAMAEKVMKLAEAEKRRPKLEKMLKQQASYVSTFDK